VMKKKEEGQKDNEKKEKDIHMEDKKKEKQ
jgi:hypothetical protein